MPFLRVFLMVLSVTALIASQPVRGQTSPVATSEIVKAAERNDLAGVKTAIARKADVNAPLGDGSTALVWAVHHGNQDMARALIAARANVSAANRLGITPLLVAARLGDAAMIDLLLKSGADLTRTYQDGETVLMAAAGTGRVDAVKLLIARGLNVNAQEREQGQTALMWAASEGHLAVVEALLAAGADPNPVAKSSALKRHPNVGSGGRMQVDHPGGGLTAVMFAAREGHLEVARRLADAKADLNKANPDGMTALMLAVLNDRIDLAAMLVDKGANANDGSLYETVQLHNITANALAGEATRPRPMNTNALTPIDLMARLLDHGADPNRLATHALHLDGTGTPQPVNETPFLRAVLAQDVKAVRLMLAKGGNPALAAAGTGQTPLHAAIGGGGGGRGGGGVIGAIAGGPRFAPERNAAEVYRLMLDAKPDVNVATTNTGDTPLHVAAQAGNVAFVQMLADHGAKLDARNKAGQTPLELVTQNAGRGVIAGPPADGGGGGGGGGGGRAGGRGGGPGGGGGNNQAQVATLLRRLMGLPEPPPTPAPAAAPAAPVAPAPSRGGGQQ